MTCPISTCLQVACRLYTQLYSLVPKILRSRDSSRFSVSMLGLLPPTSASKASWRIDIFVLSKRMHVFGMYCWLAQCYRTVHLSAVPRFFLIKLYVSPWVYSPAAARGCKCHGLSKGVNVVTSSHYILLVHCNIIL